MLQEGTVIKINSVPCFSENVLSDNSEQRNENVVIRKPSIRNLGLFLVVSLCRVCPRSLKHECAKSRLNVGNYITSDTMLHPKRHETSTTRL